MLYDASMTNNLQKAIAAVQALPTEAQDAIADELMLEVASITSSQLSASQQADLKKRLAEPYELATPDEVAAVHAKY